MKVTKTSTSDFLLNWLTGFPVPTHTRAPFLLPVPYDPAFFPRFDAPLNKQSKVLYQGTPSRLIIIDMILNLA